MQDQSPLSQSTYRIIAICGVVAFLVGLWPFGLGFFGALLFGIVIAAIVAVYLMWREGQSRDDAGAATGGMASHPRSVAETQTPPLAATTDAQPSSASSDPDAVTAPAAPVSSSDPVAAAPAEPESPRPSPKEPATPRAVVQPTKPLAGQDELAAKKGEWKYQPEPAPAKTAATAAPSTAATSADKPRMLSAPREGGADDLKRIKGVGPGMESLLNSMGVYHFDQIAGWTDKEVQWVDENLKGFKGRVTRDAWVAQAKDLANG